MHVYHSVVYLSSHHQLDASRSTKSNGHGRKAMTIDPSVQEGLHGIDPTLWHGF